MGSRISLRRSISLTSLSTASRSCRRAGGPEWKGNRLGANRAKNEQNMLDKMKVVVHVRGGEHLVQAYFASRTATIPEDLFDPSVRREPYGPAEAYPNSRSCALPDR